MDPESIQIEYLFESFVQALDCNPDVCCDGF
jgi:hypothetical protein